MTLTKLECANTLPAVSNQQDVLSALAAFCTKAESLLQVETDEHRAHCICLLIMQIWKELHVVKGEGAMRGRGAGKP